MGVCIKPNPTHLSNVILLQPRKFKYKTRQKGRTTLTWTYADLNYGECGLKTLNPLRMSSRQIFRMKIVLKKAVRKSDLTKRRAWFNTFPHLPLTKKSKGMRMGKGSGKLNAWQSFLRGGSFLFEFRNLRPGRAVYYFRRLAVKLPTKTQIVFRGSRRFKLPGQAQVNPQPRGF